MKTDDKSVRVGVDDVRPWTLTSTGVKVYYLEPTIDMFNMIDIAHHLGNLCRFTGGTRHFYSVAQHSVFVGQIMKRMLDDEGVDRTVEYWDQILAALLHEGGEFICNDIASPLKGAIRGRYQWIEIGILRKIFEKYGIDWGYYNQSLKACDNIALQVERYYLMPDHPDWPKIDNIEGYPKPEFWDPMTATQNFADAVKMALVARNGLRAEASPEAAQ